MRVLAITHQRDAGPGVFAEAIASAGAGLDEWFIPESDSPPADPLGYDAVLTLGGSMDVDQEDGHSWLVPEKALLRELIERGAPLLGVCLGAQLVSEAAGGDPRRAREPEIGWFEIEVAGAGADDPLIGPLAPAFEGFEWHSFECGPPPEATVLARTPLCVQAFRVGETTWGIQFHAEVAAADAARWISDYRSDPDAVRIGVDPEALAAETAPRMAAWNELGRALCLRFLEVARVRVPASPI